MSARQNILSRVRSALGRAEGAPPSAAPEVRIYVTEAPVEARVQQFCAALEKLAARTYIAPNPQCAGDYVRTVVGGRSVVMSASPLLRDCGLQYEDAPVSEAAVGITSAEYGLADTGTLVVMSASESRLASLLPPVHIAIIESSRILTGLDALLTVEAKPAIRTASMVLITGPSRTADIEQILVRGVHGPGELHVVILS